MQSDAAGQSSNPEKELSLMQYRRLRAPSEHGESLQLPPLGRCGQVFEANLNQGQQLAKIQIGDVELKSLQETGRQELIEAARQYTSQYLDVDLSDRCVDQIVMSGHQPELFHPGVWFKNFALAQLGKQLNCIAINLVVDNDVCGSAAIRYPALANNGESVSVGTIPLVAPGPNVPFESRRIDDLDFFGSFADRAATAIAPLVKDPLVRRVWEQLDEVKDCVAAEPLLGRAIAMGRHRTEAQFGLRTLEVPVSRIAASKSFAVFAASIIFEIERFQTAYNNALAEYRTVHGIRSAAHPVPELVAENGWLEAPFWVWQPDAPKRKRLFVKLSNTTISVTDREGWESSLELDKFAQQFSGLTDGGVLIRPRALITTMYSRLVLSDLFIHGIGGAKYDQLTDVVASRFFGSAPPSIVTISATMKIPNDFDLPSRGDLIALRQLRREIEFHPETKVDSITPEVQAIIERKQELIDGLVAGQRTRERHLAIQQANQELQPFTTPGFAEVSQRIAATAGDLRKSAVLNSREYSFALFPESLMEALAEMAK